MRIKDRVQRVLWAIGRPFCAVPSEQLRDTTAQLAADIYLMRLHQEEDRRRLEVQAKAIEITTAHVAECNQDRIDLRARMEAINDDRLQMLKILAGEKSDDIHLLENQG